jgi:spermidine synthase
MPGLSILIAFCAMSIIALQVVWMRMFAIESFSSFGFMILSIGLLGFGVGGALVSLFAPVFKRNKASTLYWFSVAYPVAVALAFLVSKYLPFVPQTVLQDKMQWVYIFIFYVVLCLPFLVGSCIIGTILSTAGDRVGKLYFADLVGSGLGGLVVLGAFWWVHPDHLPLVTLVLFLPGLLAAVRMASGRWASWRMLPVLLVLLGSGGILWGLCGVQFSEYKGISYTLAASSVNHSRVVEERFGPLGYVQVVESTTERSAPGLSTLAEHLPPVQMGLYIDGSPVATIARPMDPEESRFLDWMLSSVSYHLTENPRVLVVGLGGGMGVVQALHFNPRGVTVVEVDGSLVDLLQESLRAETGGLLDRSDVQIAVTDGRHLAAQRTGEFDVIQLSFMDASGLSFGGGKSVSENYLFTVESLKAFLTALAPGGILAISSSVEEPPRSSLRVLPGVLAAFREVWPEGSMADSVVYLRSEFHGLLLVSSSPFTEEQIATVLEEAWRLGATASYYPGKTAAIRSEQAQEEDSYWAGLQERTGVDLSESVAAEDRRDPFFDLLSAYVEGDAAVRSYLAEYPFNIGPTRDDRPFFSALLKPGTLEFIRRGAYNPERWTREIPPDLWAQPMVLITLAQAILFAGLILLMPMLGARRRIQHPGMWRTFVYFACLAVGFMFVEMVLIQKFTLFVAAPSYAAGVVLSGMLVFSGIGASLTSRFTNSLRRGLTIAVSAIVLLSIVYALGLTPLLVSMMGLPEWARVVLSVVVVSPIALFLGMPFPLAMMGLSRRHGDVPAAWGWAVNGALSVVGVVVAQLLAVEFGFTVVLVSTAVIYGTAYGVFRKVLPS